MRGPQAALSGEPSCLDHGRCTAPASRGGGHGLALGLGLLVSVLGLRDAQGDRGAEPAPGVRAPHGAAAHPALLRVVRWPGHGGQSGGRGSLAGGMRGSP